ncbi:helix-turn-helix domain-containing protein [Methylocystis sp. IM2]|jgi:transcriptional regulator with XRE-family HTH domain|uniref:helix-turn-helix domain-containing protein n=1 Tax=unclassified Methylocystis TaxID=2625913 RepID=UPI0040487B1C
MSTEFVSISPEQLRAARGLLNWSRTDLASAAGVSAETVNRAEGLRKDQASAGAMAKLRAALEAAGVEFIPENGGGSGVRLRKARADMRAR